MTTQAALPLHPRAPFPRTVTVTITGAADNLGRCLFVADWDDPTGEWRDDPHPEDGKPVGYRRAQCYQTDPDEFAARLRADGHRVEVRT